MLREKLGEDGADSLVELINKADAGVKEDVLVFVEEKFERRLTEELSKITEKNDKTSTSLLGKIAETNTSLLEKIDKTNTSLLEKIAEMNTVLSEKIAQTNINIAETKAEIIRLMFIFWAGQIGVMIGILFAFFKR